MAKRAITVAYGDGIGPEIMEAVLHILKEGGADIAIEEVEVGEQVYLKGHPTGIEESAWESIRRTKVFLKAPMTTPQGGGFKSLNVTIRTKLGLFANVRPCVSYHPFVFSKHPGMDVVIIRENEEDLYTGIEYRQTQETYHSVKLLTRPGSEKIIRYAFEYARRYGRKKVTCFTKDNIMKISDGLFHRLFDQIALECPDLENEHWIVDIGAAKFADTPEKFDVLVLPNLYGDILSDVGAQIAGSVGLAGSANIGLHGAMFEAIHGSAPRRAGQNLANPSGLLLAAVMLLNHIGQFEAAARIHNAWLKTLEDGVHTYDIFREGTSTKRVGTREFAHAIVARLGQAPHKLTPVTYGNKGASSPFTETTHKVASEQKALVGVDLFLEHSGPVEKVQALAAAAANEPLRLEHIGNRGAIVWPGGIPETFCVDQWRCRYLSSQPIQHQEVAQLLSRLAEADVDFTKLEHLYTFDQAPGYCLAARL